MDINFETTFDAKEIIVTDAITATATEVDEGVEIAVTDKNGTTTGLVRNGKDGKAVDLQNVEIYADTAVNIPPLGADAPVSVVFRLPEHMQAGRKIIGMSWHEAKDEAGQRIWCSVVQSFTMSAGTELKISLMGATAQEKTAAKIGVTVLTAER